MSKKYIKKFYRTILFQELLKVPQRPLINIKIPMITNLDYNYGGSLLNTSKFFKKSAFIGMAISQVTIKSYRIVTLKSTLVALWNSIAAYNFIF